ncbi:MAG: Fibronectin type III domain protein, partial [Candidatus Jorgensenbacteria bacterium GW2011_GWC1_48_8]
AVFATVTVLVINPAELIRARRDSTRLSDLNTINKTLGLLQTDQPGASFGSSNKVYVSIPDTSATCVNLGLPALPSGWTYGCVTTANLYNVNGTGWIPVNLMSFSAGSPLSRLPVDPINATSTGNYYTYVTGGSWEFTAFPESSKYKMGGGSDKTSGDGGPYPELFEIGSNLALHPVSRDTSLKGYWNFEEGSGATTYDSSGAGNVGTWNGSGSHWASGRVGTYGGQFNGTNDYLDVGNTSSLNITGNITFMAWVYLTSLPGTGQYRVINRGVDGGFGMYVGAGDHPDDIECGIRTSNGGRAISSDGYASNILNMWTHLACVYDGSALRLYVNGSQIGSASASGENNVGGYNTSVRIGSDWLPGKFFPGRIDTVRIYDRGLSADEVRAIYESANN